MSAARFLEKVLLVVWWGLLILAIIVTIDSFGESTGYEVLMELVYTVIYLYAIAKLRKIVDTVAAENPFTGENVNRFKQIGYAIFIVGLFDTIVRFPVSKEGSLLIGTPYGGINTSVLIYVIFGCLALILAEVFGQALEIKEDNEFTI